MAEGGSDRARFAVERLRTDGGGGPETPGQGTAGHGSQPVAAVAAGRMAARQARRRWRRRVRSITAHLLNVAFPVPPYPENRPLLGELTLPRPFDVVVSRQAAIGPGLPGRLDTAP